MDDPKIVKAAEILKQGGVVIAPTEGLYGVSCLASNDRAVERVIKVKERSSAKGLIVAVSSFEMAQSLIDFSKLISGNIDFMLSMWPGPHTFIVPAAKSVSSLVTGGRDNIALRFTAFSTLQRLCELSGGPLISSSANISGQPPLMTLSDLNAVFGGKVDYILDLPCQGLKGPSSIHDAITGKLLRKGGV